MLSNQSSIQTDAVFDAWALGRRDARYLLILHRVILELEPIATRRAIALLSHCAPHPDIFWTPDNWIRPEIEKQVQPSFRWSPQEIVHMFTVVDVEEWGRGSLGQSTDVLIYEDPNARRSLHSAVGILLDDDKEDIAVRVATLALERARDQQREVAALSAEFPKLMSHEWFTAIATTIRENGRMSFY